MKYHASVVVVAFAECVNPANVSKSDTDGLNSDNFLSHSHLLVHTIN